MVLVLVRGRIFSPSCVNCVDSCAADSSSVCVGSYLRVCDGHRTNAGVDGGPGASGEHAGEQRVQIPGSQSAAVMLHLGYVSFNQSLPQMTVVQPEVWLQPLEGRGRYDGGDKLMTIIKIIYHMVHFTGHSNNFFHQKDEFF